MVFVEPDRQAGIVEPGSRIRLNKLMRPKKRREPFAGLIPCFVAIFVVALVKGAFEVMTIEMCQDLWKWDVMRSALFLGGTMLAVASTTLVSYKLANILGEGRLLVFGALCAAILMPFYYIPTSDSPRFQMKMGTNLGMGIYLAISILALASLNLARTIAFSLTTELPSPHWRSYFLSIGSQIFTVGRGVGPIVVGVVGPIVVISLLI